jgi:hypothetical protein
MAMHLKNIGILKGPANIFGITHSTELFIGLVLVAGAVKLRTLVEGIGWWSFFLEGKEKDRLKSIKVRDLAQIMRKIK